MVIDIGSNIGLYSLFSSKLGRDVLSVEPFKDNIIRFHKAVKIQGLENRITLLNNVVYNKPGIIKKIYYQHYFLGIALLDHRNQMILYVIQKIRNSRAHMREMKAGLDVLNQCI